MCPSYDCCIPLFEVTGTLKGLKLAKVCHLEHLNEPVGSKWLTYAHWLDLVKRLLLFRQPETKEPVSSHLLILFLGHFKGHPTIFN